MPGGYLSVVVGIQAWVEVLARTGDAGFAGVWPLLATAPVSVLALPLTHPAPDPVSGAPVHPVHTGPEPPAPLVLEEPPLSPPPSGWAVDPGIAEQPEVWAGLGLYGAVLAGALVNATALWALVRCVVHRRQAARQPS
ncbi:SCO4225 family membrane protein [Streptomyces sp. NPDC058646]|uniref:SCO4225 family membrane protein n=1 Tax=Streptomyces sp. NPDC058646 TaxID=3346574 RepID=UPI00365B0C7F